MGRPRQHDERTRIALLRAAEKIVAERGPAALSVRAVAEAAGTSTRAVYTVFGSKDGLLVQALARDAFAFLYAEIDALDETDDPAADLIAIGTEVFRRLVLDHPALYRIAFQRVVPGLDASPELVAERQKTWDQLIAKVERLEHAGLLVGKTSAEAAVEFIATMEGLGNAELRGAVLRLLPEGSEGDAWETALATLLRGFAAAPKAREAGSAGLSRGSGKGP